MTDRVVAVFGSSNVRPESPEYDDAELLGRLLAKAGFAVATGGYHGVMEAVSKGAGDSGGQVIGVTAPPVFPGRAGVNGYVTREMPASSLTHRIDTLIDIADAFVVLPGSIGTLTELMVAWNSAFVTQFSEALPKPIVAVGEQWKETVPRLARELDTDSSYVSCVGTVEEAGNQILAALS